ncbi:MAG: hypothetical protein WCO51_06135 [bacterium]
MANREKLTPEQLRECDEVYFINRIRNNTILPLPAQTLLASHEGRDTSVLLVRQIHEDGLSIVVFDVPSQLQLERKAKQFNNVDAVAIGVTPIELNDLRVVDRTVLLVPQNPSGMSANLTESIRLGLASDLRTQAKMNVMERGPNLTVLEKEVTLQELMGSPDTRKNVRMKTGLRHVWLFQVTSLDRQTTYIPSQKSLSDKGAFNEYEPPEPSKYKGFIWNQTKKTPAEYARDYREWEQKHDEWKQRKLRYEYYDPCQWERTLTQNQTATVTGMLTLFDLDDEGKVIWQKECTGDSLSSTILRTDQITIAGYLGIPDSIVAPEADSNCEESLVIKASRNAGNIALGILLDESLLRTGAPLLTPEPKPEPEPKSISGPIVLEVDSIILQATTSLGNADGLKIGDTIIIITKTREIKGQDGEVTEEVPLEQVHLRLTRVGKTSDCVPISETDKTLFVNIKPNMSVSFVRAPTFKLVPLQRPKPTIPKKGK